MINCKIADGLLVPLTWKYIRGAWVPAITVCSDQLLSKPRRRIRTNFVPKGGCLLGGTSFTDLFSRLPNAIVAGDSNIALVGTKQIYGAGGTCNSSALVQVGYRATPTSGANLNGQALNTITPWSPSQLSGLLWDSGEDPAIGSAIPAGVSTNLASFEVWTVSRGSGSAAWQLGTSGFTAMHYSGGIDSNTAGQSYFYTTGPTQIAANTYWPRVSQTVHGFRTTGGNSTLNINGYDHSSVVNAFSGTATGGTVGDKNGGGWALNGTVRRMIISSPLSTNDRTLMLSYLRNTYSIPAYTRQVLCCGDSITAGYNSSANFILNGWTSGDYTHSYPYYLAQAQPSWKMLNHGVTAITLATMTTNDTSGVDLYRNAAAFASNVCVVWAGTNDLSVDNVDAVTLQSRFTSYCNARVAAGWTVVAVSMVDRGNFTTDQRAIKTAFNSWLRSTPPASVSALVDLDTVSGLAGDSPWTAASSLWDSDHIHLSRTGYQLAAGAIGTVVAGV